MQAYGIFEHHRERTPTGGGLVARAVYDDGSAHDQFNYGGLVPIKVYKTERGADAYVDRKYRERVGS
jgi:hypothetical protein